MTPPSGASGRTILVVDDHAVIPGLLREYLPRLGYAVETALDGLEALAVMGRTRIDLVLLDLDMPRLDGLGVLSAMGLDPALGKIPVLAMTGRPNRDLRKRALNAGALDFIEKPFDLRSLKELIERHLGRPGGQGRVAAPAPIAEAEES